MNFNNWIESIKNRISSLFESGKEGVKSFNERPLWNKLLIMVAVHFILRLIFGKEKK